MTESIELALIAQIPVLLAVLLSHWRLTHRAKRTEEFAESAMKRSGKAQMASEAVFRQMTPDPTKRQKLFDSYSSAESPTGSFRVPKFTKEE